MSDFDKEKGIRLFGMADAASDLEAQSSFNLTRTYLQKHGKTFRDLFSEATQTVRLIDTTVLSQIDDLERERTELQKTVTSLKGKIEAIPAEHKKLVAALEAQVATEQRENKNLERKNTELKTRLAKKDTDLTAKKGRGRLKGFFAGVVATTAIGSIIGYNSDTDIGGQLRTRSVGVFSLLGSSAESVSAIVPPLMWYKNYLTVTTDSADIRLAEDNKAKSIAAIDRGSCVMIRKNANYDSDWLRVEQRVDGKLISGYIKKTDQQVQPAYIGKPCVAFKFER